MEKVNLNTSQKICQKNLFLADNVSVSYGEFVA